MLTFSRIALILLAYTLLTSSLPAAAPLSGDNRTIHHLSTLTVNSPEPNHFVAVHGQRSLVMGYPQSGLEIWAYPFQILSDYQVRFRPVGAAAYSDGRLLLRRIDYRPESVTRTYIGPDYLVREKLFVPLQNAAAVLSYQVEGIRALEIEIHFQPVLNLMWPAGLGGQYTRWRKPESGEADVPAFVISEPGQGFSAAIGSREIVAHDDTVNSTVQTNSGLNFSLHPSRGTPSLPAIATVYVALNPANVKNPAEAINALASQSAQLEAAAIAHYDALSNEALRIITPDDDANQSTAWAIAALDQAWVCNDKLGCGLVAGYGPSRDARRPQYAWFFGGDGLVATNALISAGEYSRAREELAFIQRYQDPASGMIWHELSQSAGFLDWSKYPYMFVHVDISFDYLSTVAHYVGVTGDLPFANEHWPSIAAAYQYCRTQIQDSDHLPHIPSNKEAGDEQHRPADDLSLSASWLSAATGFVQLATLTGHTQQAQSALQQVQLTRQSIPIHYWSSANHFWFDGHTPSGDPIFRHALGPTQLLAGEVFSAQQSEAVLKQLTSADFQSDWGIRQVSAASKDYNPYSYGSGSISALGTSAAAVSLWQAHRADSAFGLWKGIVQWNTFDSLGHLHEVFAGNFFHEETESVPEQTWSSAGLLDASVRGLLGLEIDALANRLTFAPHVPAAWPDLAVEHIHLPQATLAITLRQNISSVDLIIDNQGSSTTMLFSPQIPLGAHVLSAEFQGHQIKATQQRFAGDEHIAAELPVPAGMSHCHISFEGGVSLLLDHPVLHVGDASTQPKLIDVRLQNNTLSLDADINGATDSAFRIRTPWTIAAGHGAAFHALPDHQYAIHFEGSASSNFVTARRDYRSVHIELVFTPPVEH